MYKEVYLAFFYLLPIVIGLEECKEAGIFPGSKAREFVVCTNISGELVRSEHSCSSKTVFSSIKNKCVTPSSQYLARSLINPRKLQTEPVELECTKTRQMCKNCHTFQVCMSKTNFDGSVVVEPIVTQSCGQDEVCQFKKGCAKVADGGFCSLKPFACSDIGTYPDPYNCRKYYFCIDIGKDIQAFPSKCADGSYNPDTTTCGWPDDQPNCIDNPIKYCEEEFEIGAVGNGSIYYVCTRDDDGQLGPDLYRCSGDRKFNKSTLSCE